MHIPGTKSTIFLRNIDPEMTLVNSPAPFIYQAFGLILSSEIVFPELFMPDSPAGISSDVSIRLGKAPAKESITGTQKPFSAYNATEFWFLKPGIALYYVKEGREIVIELLGGSEEEVRLFFLSNALGALLYQRDLIPLHASGVITASGDVYLFTAPSRTGKSTLLYMLTQMGCRPFTDDVCVLQPDEQEGAETAFYATASYPVMKLWGETIKKFEADAPQAQRKLRPDIDKYGVNFHHAFDTSPLKVKGIIILEADKAGKEISIEKLSALDAFRAVEKNVYRRHWVEGMGKGIAHFRHVGALANNIPVYLAKRPVQQDTIRTFAGAIHQVIAPGQEA